MIREDPDLSFVQALKAGQDQALEALMNRHRKGIFHFILRHIPNEADAVELTTEVFVRVYFNIGKFRPSAKFATWLYQIALNLCRDHLKSRAYQHSLQTLSFGSPGQEEGDLEPVAEDRPDQKTERLEELLALQKAIAELPHELREAFILTAFGDHPQAETAELLGISVKAVGMKVYRARKMLLEKMSQMGF